MVSPLDLEEIESPQPLEVPEKQPVPREPNASEIVKVLGAALACLAHDPSLRFKNGRANAAAIVKCMMIHQNAERLFADCQLPSMKEETMRFHIRHWLNKMPNKNIS